MAPEVTYRFGLLGERIASSLSPRLYSWAMHATGVRGTYALYDFPRKLARSFIVNSRLEWDGLNVTSPYKDLAYELCDELSESAQKVRAVNTIYRNGSKICGDNTDVSGFGYALSKQLTQFESSSSRKVLIIGSGGAARAAGLALSLVMPAADVSVASRRPVSAHDRMGDVLSLFSTTRILTTKQAVTDLLEFNLIVQATPVGGVNHPGYPLEPPLNFARDSIVIDLIYSPRKTLFMEAAEAFGARTQNGLVMLMAQAAKSFENWTNVEFPLERAERELLPELQNQ